MFSLQQSLSSPLKSIQFLAAFSELLVEGGGMVSTYFCTLESLFKLFIDKFLNDSLHDSFCLMQLHKRKVYQQIAFTKPQ